MNKYFLVLASTALVASAYAQTPAPVVAAVAASSTATRSVNAGDASRDASNEKHIKDLHAKLHITAAEEPLWKAVADTMRANTMEVDKIVDRREAAIATATAIDDINSYADVAQAHADSVKKLSVAFAPLYTAMPDAQRKIADEVFTQRGGSDKKIARAQ
jgi:protein CpxP